MEEARIEAPRTPPPLYFPDEDRRLVWMEILVVLSIAIFPSIYNSITMLMFKDRILALPFWHTGLKMIFHSIFICAPVIYIAWRSPHPLERFGLDRMRFPKDLGFGALVWIGMISGFIGIAFVAVLAIALVQPDIIQNLPDKPSTFGVFNPPEGALEYVLMLVAVCFVGFSEEFIMRGYLITRLETLFTKAWKCLLISSVLFGLCHLYQGVFAVLGTGLIGFVFGLYFWKFRRIWPIAFAHAIHDCAAFTALKYFI